MVKVDGVGLNVKAPLVGVGLRVSDITLAAAADDDDDDDYTSA